METTTAQTAESTRPVCAADGASHAGRVAYSRYYRLVLCEVHHRERDAYEAAYDL